MVAIACGEVSLRGSEQAAAAEHALHRRLAAEAPSMQLVRLQVAAGLLELAQGDERLDRVRPDGKRRVVHPSRKQPSGEVAQVAAGRFQVAEARARGGRARRA